MGGPIKPFSRCLAFDPVSTAVHSATLAPVPTYVDDEAALVATLFGLWRASLVVLAAGRAAGL
eukprot:4013473-Alexandrium_andersonii.AAC.1